jgi:hypothetical protein
MEHCIAYGVRTINRNVLYVLYSIHKSYCTVGAVDTRWTSISLARRKAKQAQSRPSWYGPRRLYGQRRQGDPLPRHGRQSAVYTVPDRTTISITSCPLCAHGDDESRTSQCSSGPSRLGTRCARPASHERGSWRHSEIGLERCTCAVHGYLLGKMSVRFTSLKHSIMYCCCA